MFADDTNIFVCGNDEKQAYENANIVLNKVDNYMVQNLLHVNLDKSVYMHFRPCYNASERLTLHKNQTVWKREYCKDC